MDSENSKRIGFWPLGLRVVGLFGHFLAGLGVWLVLPLAGGRGVRLAGWWYRRFLRLLGVRVRVYGAPPRGGVLGVSNHVSWLDIIVLGSLVDAAFVSKAEIGGWPLVGRFARHTGTVFFPRGAHRTGEAVEALRAAMAGGRCVILFPEATTKADLAPDRFHARLFAAAVETDYPAQPIAIRYLPPGENVAREERTTSNEQRFRGGHHPLAPWVDDKPLFRHFLEIVRAPGMAVVVTFCEPIAGRGYDRRGLAEACRRAITAALS